MIVKVCGITNAMDALTSLDAGADALGFNFWPGSARHVKDTAFLRDLPSDFWRVGLFVNEEPARVRDLMTEFALDIAQLHKMPTLPGLRIWQAVTVDHALRQEEVEALGVEAMVLDAPAGALEGGTGRTFDWGLAAGVTGKIVVAGGLDAANVGAAIRTLRPWGVDACSRLEAEPGKKDRDKLRAFVETAREEFAAL
jgi:phosphoribosylanthranilate isomerase